MKKRRFFTLALLSAAVIFTTSCSDDDDPLAPSLSVTETHTDITNGAVEIELGDQLEFAWETRKGDNNIKTFSLSQSGQNVSTALETKKGNVLPYMVSGSDRSIYRDTISFPNAGLNLGTTNYTFTSSDGVNSKSVSFNVTVVAPTAETTPLTDATNFEWKRGPSSVTGLAAFGLKWTSNTNTHAIIAVDGNTTMHKLSSSAWTSIETQEDLAAAMTSGTAVTKYEGVDVVAATKTYNDVLAVNYDGTNYLLHITNSLVQVETAGATVTIGGQYKK